MRNSSPFGTLYVLRFTLETTAVSLATSQDQNREIDVEAWVYLLPGQGRWYEDVLSWLTSGGRTLEVRNYKTTTDYLNRNDEPGKGCVIADTRLPDHHGVELVETICGERNRLPLILVSGRPRIEEAVACIKTGAFDYLEWPCTQETFLGSFQRAIEESERLEVLRAQRLELERRFKLLSAREREVLSLLAEGRSSKSIAAHLSVSKRTIDYHRGQIMAKVGTSNSIELVSLAYELQHLKSDSGSNGHTSPGSLLGDL